jgi:hypothetical protein
MLDDIKILLPADTRLTEMRIVDNFEQYDECMQRAVVLLMVDPTNQFRINGLSISELIRRGTTATVSILNASVSALASKLKDILNQDTEMVSEVELNVNAVSASKLEVFINITKVSGESVSGNLRL